MAARWSSCFRPLVGLLLLTQILEGAYGIDCGTAGGPDRCDWRDRVTLTAPNSFHNLPRRLAKDTPPFEEARVFTDISRPHVEVMNGAGHVKQLSLVRTGDTLGITVKTRDEFNGKRQWYTDGKISAFGRNNIMKLAPQDPDRPTDVCCEDSRVLRYTSLSDHLLFTAGNFGDGLKREDDFSVWSSSPSQWKLFPWVSLSEADAAISPDTGSGDGDDDDDDSGENSSGSETGDDSHYLQLVCYTDPDDDDDAEEDEFDDAVSCKLKNRFLGFGAGFSVTVPGLCQSTSFRGKPGVPPSSPAATINIRKYNVHDGHFDEGLGAMVIQNSASKGFLSYDIDDDFDVVLDDESDVPGRMSDLVELDSLEFNLSSKSLGEDKDYFQNSDLDKIISPDRRFFTKHYLDDAETKFVLCALHNRQNCLIERNGQLRLISVAEDGESDDDPDLESRSSEELRAARRAFKIDGVGSLAVFYLGSSSTPQDDWVHCTKGNTHFSPVPGTGCRSYTIAGAGTSGSKSVVCKPGTVWDIGFCGCRPTKSVTCLCP